MKHNALSAERHSSDSMLFFPSSIFLWYFSSVGVHNSLSLTFWINNDVALLKKSASARLKTILRIDSNNLFLNFLIESFSDSHSIARVRTA